MMHTCFFSSQRAAEDALERMKADIDSILQDIPPDTDPDARKRMDSVYESVSRFVDRYQ